MSENFPSLPKELAAFAFVAEEYAKSGDIVRGLMPIFSPLLAKKPNRVFDPSEFSAQVEEIYGIPMPLIAAEGLAPKLEEAGLLYRDSKDSRVYRISMNLPGVEAIDTTEIESIIGEFITFSQSRLNRRSLSIGAEKLGEGLLRRFTSLNFISFLSKPDRNLDIADGTLTLKAGKENEERHGLNSNEIILDILTASYVLYLDEVDRGKLNTLTKLASGALIADVILTLRTSTPTSQFDAVTVVLDGPLILDALDLSTPELKDFANDLLNLIRKAGIQIYTFKHLVAEMKGSIQSPLDTLKRGHMPYGPLGNRITREPKHAAYARAVLSDIDSFIRSLEIGVLDAQDYEGEQYTLYCSSEVFDSIRNSLGEIHESLERRINDALSVSTIQKLRGRQRREADITTCKWLFATRNQEVALRSTKCLLAKREIDAATFPPALTDRQLAGFLWFVVGGEIGDLSYRKLISNCTLVLQPRIDVISTVRKYIRESDPEKLELFTALMRDKRAQNTLVCSTFGLPSLITPNDIDDILDQMRRSTAAEERYAAILREQKMESEYQEKIAEMIGGHRNEMIEKGAELLKADEQRKSLEQKVGNLVESVEKMQSEAGRDTCERIRRAIKVANNAVKRVEIEIVFGYVLLVLASVSLKHQLGSYAIVLAILGAVLGFWVVPNHIFPPILKAVWRKELRGKANDLLVGEKLDLLKIDDNERKVFFDDN